MALGIVDGDYTTTTVALGARPASAAVDAMVANSVTDGRLMRRIASLVQASGFESIEARSHGYLDTADGECDDRRPRYRRAAGERATRERGRCGLRADAGRRVESQTFFGHIAYVGLTARRGG